MTRSEQGEKAAQLNWKKANFFHKLNLPKQMTPGFSALTLSLQDCAVVPASYWLTAEPYYWPNLTHVSKRSTNIGASGTQLRQDR